MFFRPLRDLLVAILLCAFFAGAVGAQSPTLSKEYIRLGGRAVAIESFSVGDGQSRLRAGCQAASCQSYTDAAGRVWGNDANFTGGSPRVITDAIAGTSDPTLYQSQRYGNFAYTFSGLQNGPYDVVLRFAEHSFTTAGSRTMQIKINGQTVENSFDIVAAAGASKTAVDRTYTVAVSGNSLFIEFISQVSDAAVNAIEIRPSFSIQVPARTTIAPTETATFSVTGGGSAAWQVQSGPGSFPDPQSGIYRAPASSEITGITPVTVQATAGGLTKTANLTVRPALLSDNCGSLASTAGACSISVTSSAPWSLAVTSNTWAAPLPVVSPTSGTGNQTVTLSYGANTAGVRSGTVNLQSSSTSATPLLFTQAAGASDFTIVGPDRDPIGPSETATFSVSPGTATWAKLSGPGAIGASSGIYQADATISAVTAVTVQAVQGGTTHTKAFNVSPNIVAVGGCGAVTNLAGTCTVSVVKGTTWALNGFQSWIHGTSGGSGNSTINLAYDENHSGTPRSVTITVAGGQGAVSIDQQAIPPPVISPKSAVVVAAPVSSGATFYVMQGGQLVPGTWSIDPPGIGQISTPNPSSSVTYTPPSTVASTTTVTLSVNVGGAGYADFATITISPATVPTTTLSPTSWTGTLPGPHLVANIDLPGTGASRVRQATVLIGNEASPIVHHACYFEWYEDGSVQMHDDKGAYQAPVGTVGTGLLANNQCQIDLSQSSMTTTATGRSLQFALSFTPIFGSVLGKTAWVNATNAQNLQTGFQAQGNWLVPLDQSLPVTISATPSPLTLNGAVSGSLVASMLGLSDQRLAFSLSPFGGGIAPSSLTLINGPTQFFGHTVNYTPPAGTPGGQVILTATSLANPSKSLPITINLGSAPVGFPIRSHAGGTPLGDLTEPGTGNIWTADAGFVYDGYTLDTWTEGPIPNVFNTTFPDLYRRGRFRNDQFKYRFGDLPNGGYTVVLKFAQLLSTVCGNHKISVYINGLRVEGPNFDPCVLAGGSFRAIDRTYPINVTSREIVVQIVADLGRAQLAGIEIRQGADYSIGVSPATLSLNQGAIYQFHAYQTGPSSAPATWSLVSGSGTISSSGVYTAPATVTGVINDVIKATSVSDPSKTATANITVAGSLTPIRYLLGQGFVDIPDGQGNVWHKDDGSFSGGIFSVGDSISNTSEPWMYQNEREANIGGGSISGTYFVPNGTYAVTLKHAEINASTCGHRPFSTTINGLVVDANFDPCTAAGGIRRAVDRTFTVLVTDGFITIQLNPINGSVPQICALQIAQIAGAAPVNITLSPSTSLLRPNEAQQLTPAVTGTNNTGVTWTVSPSGMGSMSGSVYTAPTTIAAPQNVQVTARSLADPSKYASANISLEPASGAPPNISVSLDWNPGSVALGAIQRFRASVFGTNDHGVTLSLSPNVGSLLQSSTSNRSVIYSAPKVLATATNVTLRATSTADPSKYKEVTFTVDPGLAPRNSVDPTLFYRLIAQESHLALDVAGSSVQDGSYVQQSTPDAAIVSQQWYMVPRTPSQFELRARHSNKCAMVEGPENTRPLKQFGCVASDAYRWASTAVSPGVFKLLNASSGRAIDVTSHSLASGQVVQQYDYLNGANQQWEMVPVGIQSIPGNTRDFNLDGKDDLVFQDLAAGATSVLYLNGVEPLSTAAILPPTTSILRAVGDFNGDDQPDLLWQSADNQTLFIQLMNGVNPSSSAPIVLPSPSGQIVAGVGDFDGDRKLDILFRNRKVWYMDFTTKVSESTIAAYGSYDAAACGDFNGDGKADIVFNDASTGAVVIGLVNGTSLSSSVVVLSSEVTRVVGVGDLNGDGQNDIIFQYAADGRTFVWYMNGTNKTTGVQLTQNGNVRAL